MTAQLKQRGGSQGLKQFQLSFPRASRDTVEEFFDVVVENDRTMVRLRPPPVKNAQKGKPGLSKHDLAVAMTMSRLMGRFGQT
jgi:hypothetical protein